MILLTIDLATKIFSALGVFFSALFVFAAIVGIIEYFERKRDVARGIKKGLEAKIKTVYYQVTQGTIPNNRQTTQSFQALMDENRNLQNRLVRMHKGISNLHRKLDELDATIAKAKAKRK
jgi:predicted RNase H-like nuclease (RuvC/YqgF family)